MQSHIRVHLKWLQAELKNLNLELHDRLQDHAAWQAKTELLRSNLAVGPVVAACASPSCRYRGQPCVWERCAPVCTMPCMVTATASHHNPAIHAFHTRFVPTGPAQESSTRRSHAQAAPHPERGDSGPDPPVAQPRAFSAWNCACHAVPPLCPRAPNRPGTGRSTGDETRALEPAQDTDGLSTRLLEP